MLYLQYSLALEPTSSGSTLWCVSGGHLAPGNPGSLAPQHGISGAPGDLCISMRPIGGGPVTHETMGNYGLMGFNGDYRGSMNQKTGMLVDIPSGYVKIAIENGHL